MGFTTDSTGIPACLLQSVNLSIIIINTKLQISIARGFHNFYYDHKKFAAKLLGSIGLDSSNSQKFKDHMKFRHDILHDNIYR